MIFLVLWTVTMFLWFIVALPVAQLAPFAQSRAFFAWTAVLLLGLYLFVPALR